jgi:Pectobacterium phage endonuclease
MDYRAPNLVKARAARAKMLPTMEERFWARAPIGPVNQCWVWTGAKLNNGYGYLSITRKGKVRVLTAHRLSVEISMRLPIPPGMHVLHSCDNPGCVNPRHLSIGTHKENMADMANKNRHAFGMKSGRSKLTTTQVRAIRKSSAPHKVLADKYGIKKLQVYRIQHGLTWRSLAWQ